MMNWLLNRVLFNPEPANDTGVGGGSGGDGGTGDAGGGGNGGGGSDNLIAGKFKDEAALDQGYNALADKLGLNGVVQTTFENVDAKANAYKQLESKLGGQTKVTHDQVKNVKLDLSGSGSEEAESFEQIVEKAGFKKEELRDQILGKGDLTEEQYKALQETSKMPMWTIKDRVALETKVLQAASRDREDALVMAAEMAGGKEQLEAVLAYGRTLPQAEKESIQARLDNPALRRGAMTELLGRYEQQYGRKQTVYTGDGGGGGADESGFKDVQALREYVKKNGRDSTYRKKIANTDDYIIGSM